MSSQALLRALSAVIDPQQISTDAALMALLAHDALHPERLPAGVEFVQPLGIVRPRHTADVVAVMRFANAHHVPVMPMGGGSGLMGGAASVLPGIVLDLRGLQDVHIRAADRMADVGAGVTIHALNVAAAPHSLMCAHDPWTVAVATVGGTIGTNSLGYLGGKYGAMGDQVLGLEAVLPTGEVMETRAVEKTSTGPNLSQFFVGAEGCFGVVTRATLRLWPLPPARLLQAWRFVDFATGFAAVDALLRAGLRPGLLEYGDENPSADQDTPAILFLSYEGPQRVAHAEAEEGAAVCTQHRGQLLPPQHVEAFWTQRHDRGNAYAEARTTGQRWYPQRPPLDYLHVALPPSAVLEYRRRSLALLAERQLQALQTGLWGHAGLFNLVFAGGDVRTLAAAQPALLEVCHELQGAMEYCHGVGVRLASLMAREHGAGLTVLRRLKQSLDPQGILNPGKLQLQ